jgi:hypothetical protein
MNEDIRLGVLLPTGQAQWGEGTDPRRLVGFAVRAEALGRKGRFTRLDDTVALWRHIWTSEGSGSFHGRVLHFDELFCSVLITMTSTTAAGPRRVHQGQLRPADRGRRDHPDHDRRRPSSHVAAELGRYVSAGVRHIACRIGALDLRSQLDQPARLIKLTETLNGARR